MFSTTFVIAPLGKYAVKNAPPKFVEVRREKQRRHGIGEKLMDDDLVKRLRDAAKISEALAVLLPHSEGNATAKLYNDAADAIEELSARVSSLER